MNYFYLYLYNLFQSIVMDWVYQFYDLCLKDNKVISASFNYCPNDPHLFITTKDENYQPPYSNAELIFIDKFKDVLHFVIKFY